MTEQRTLLRGHPGFNGELCDPLTGHYLLGNGYRAYNPVLMRFNSPDSLSPFGEGGVNAYGYCQGDPLNQADPSGRLPVFLAWLTMKKLAVVASGVTAFTALAGAVAVKDERLRAGLGVVATVAGIAGTVGAFRVLRRPRLGSVDSAVNSHTLAEYSSPSPPRPQTPPPPYEYPPAYEEAIRNMRGVRRGYETTEM